MRDNVIKFINLIHSLKSTGMKKKYFNVTLAIIIGFSAGSYAMAPEGFEQEEYFTTRQAACKGVFPELKNLLDQY